MTINSQPTEMDVIDVASYQQFWETVPAEMLTKYEGQCLALQSGPDGWEIVGAAVRLAELHKSLTQSGHDMSKIVFDQIHTEEATAPGIELQ